MSLGREVLCIRIKISKTLTDIISVRERDEPYLLAQKFCQKHKLTENNALDAITYIIDKNLDILIEEELTESQNKKQKVDFYKKSIHQQAQIKAKVDKMREKLELEKSLELTFKPTICRQSADLLKKSTEKIKKSNTGKALRLNKYSPGPLIHSRYKNDEMDFECTKKPISFMFTDPGERIQTEENTKAKEVKYRPLSVFQNFKDFSSSILKNCLKTCKTTKGDKTEVSDFF
ncbi:hypothetical protein SteCoe_19072 [Stentor coeruleus]|uniref:Uncharacterized protein n=1 Tax=Stentor coeruleus TaxID=5963 RepID=A0A1R2BV10_9CILI|nr:hypothetical protein SteCoe_19072 [Stentor coeruleus]